MFGTIGAHSFQERTFRAAPTETLRSQAQEQRCSVNLMFLTTSMLRAKPFKGLIFKGSIGLERFLPSPRSGSQDSARARILTEPSQLIPARGSPIGLNLLPPASTHPPNVRTRCQSTRTPTCRPVWPPTGSWSHGRPTVERLLRSLWLLRLSLLRVPLLRLFLATAICRHSCGAPRP